MVDFTPISLGLTCMLIVYLYRKGAMEWEKREVGNVSFRWWKKLECLERTTSQLQVTDNLLITLVRDLTIEIKQTGPSKNNTDTHIHIHG